jgi:multicomponent Na+:H+ antiporter subunit F
VLTLSGMQLVAAVLIGLSVVLCMLRLLLGPTTLDRLVAADTLAVISTAVLVAVAAWLNDPVYLDIALVFATLAFVGTVAIARSLERVKT